MTVHERYGSVDGAVMQPKASDMDASLPPAVAMAGTVPRLDQRTLSGARGSQRAVIRAIQEDTGSSGSGGGAKGSRDTAVAKPGCATTPPGAAGGAPGLERSARARLPRPPGRTGRSVPARW